MTLASVDFASMYHSFSAMFKAVMIGSGMSTGG